MRLIGILSSEERRSLAREDVAAFLEPAFRSAQEQDCRTRTVAGAGVVDSMCGTLSDADRAKYQPPGSQNSHYYCPCERKEYLGVDATRLLGVTALNLAACGPWRSATSRR